MGTIEAIIIPLAWAILLGVILYFRFRKEDASYGGSMERRKSDRRTGSRKTVMNRSARGKRFEGEDKREPLDRRQNTNWQEEYRSLKSRLEKDHTV